MRRLPEWTKELQYINLILEALGFLPGENPATWMLTTIGAGSAKSNEEPLDYVRSYSKSKLHVRCLDYQSIYLRPIRLRFFCTYGTMKLRTVQ